MLAALLGAFPDCAVAAPPTVKNDLVVQSRVLLLPLPHNVFRTFAGRHGLSKATSMRDRGVAGKGVERRAAGEGEFDTCSGHFDSCQRSN